MRNVIWGVALLLIALPFLAQSGVAAQSIATFGGTVKSQNGEPLGGAQIIGRVSGQVCGETTSTAAGTYRLSVPDDPARRPSLCLQPNTSVSIYVNGSHVSNAAVGTAGSAVQLDLQPGGAAAPPSAPSSFTLAFNGTPAPGPNAAALIGSAATTEQLEAEAVRQSGSSVEAIWIFEGEWKVFVPRLVAQFSSVTPPRALYVVLGPR